MSMYSSLYRVFPEYYSDPRVVLSKKSNPAAADRVRKKNQRPKKRKRGRK